MGANDVAQIGVQRRFDAVAPPTLDEIARDPAAANRLSPERAHEMLAACSAALSALRERATQLLLPLATERLLDSREVAALLGVSKSWVEKNARKLPLRISMEGNAKWRLAEIEEWIRSRPRYGAAV